MRFVRGSYPFSFPYVQMLLKSSYYGGKWSYNDNAAILQNDLDSVFGEQLFSF